MFCTKCGNRTSDNAKFCNICGNDLRSESYAPPINPQTNMRQPVEEPKQSQQPMPIPPTPYTPTPNANKALPVNAPPSPPPQNYGQYYHAAPKINAEPKKPRTAPPKPTGSTKALTAVFCVFFCLFFLVTSVIGITRNMLAKDNIERIVKEIDIDDIHIEMDGSTYVLPEFIYRNLGDELSWRYSERDIRSFLNTDKTRIGIASLISGYTEYFISGMPMCTIDTISVIDALRNCGDEIYSETGKWYSFDYMEIGKILEESIDFTALEKQEIRRVVPVSLELLQFLLSPLCYGILIFLTVAFLALLFIVNRKNLCYMVSKVTIVFIALGAVYLLMTLCGVYFVFFPLLGAQPLSVVFAAFNRIVVVRAAILLVLGVGGKVLSSLLRKKEAKIAA